MDESRLEGHYRGHPSRPALNTFLAKLMFPLVRIALRYGISVYEIEEMVRWVAVRLCLEDPEFQLPDKKPTKARAAILTGLSRREIQRLARLKSLERALVLDRCNRAARILGAWLTDPQFRTPRGKPRPLPFDSEQGRSFVELVACHGGDVPPRAVLDELLDVGSVRYQEGWIVVNDPFLIPDKKSEEFMQVASISVRDFLAVIEHNIKPEESNPFMQREAFSPRIAAEKAPAIEFEIRTDTLKHLRRVHRLLVQESDHEKRSGVEYKRIGLGVYYFEVVDDEE